MPKRTEHHCRNCRLLNPDQHFPTRTQCKVDLLGKFLDDRFQFRDCRDITPKGPINERDRRLEHKLPKSK